MIWPFEKHEKVTRDELIDAIKEAEATRKAIARQDAKRTAAMQHALAETLKQLKPRTIDSD